MSIYSPTDGEIRAKRTELITKAIAEADADQIREALCDMDDAAVLLMRDSYQQGEAITIFDLYGDALRYHFAIETKAELAEWIADYEEYGRDLADRSKERARIFADACERHEGRV